MPGEINLTVMELLSARMCHDLISPVSAIANGIELVTEFEDEMKGEALSLIGDSAQSASRLLQFYRAAFGSARSAQGGILTLAEARQRVLDAVGGGRIQVDWPEETETDGRLVGRLGLKLLMNMALAGSDILPGNGILRVTLMAGPNGLDADIRAEKAGLALSDDLRGALTGQAAIESLSAKSVVSYLCWLLAQDIGQDLEVTDGGLGPCLHCLLAWA